MPAWTSTAELQLDASAFHPHHLPPARLILSLHSRLPEVHALLVRPILVIFLHPRFIYLLFMRFPF